MSSDEEGGFEVIIASYHDGCNYMREAQVLFNQAVMVSGKEFKNQLKKCMSLDEISALEDLKWAKAKAARKTAKIAKKKFHLTCTTNGWMGEKINNLLKDYETQRKKIRFDDDL